MTHAHQSTPSVSAALAARSLKIDTPDGRRVYVSNEEADNVSVIDTSARKVIATIPIGKGPKRLTVGRVVTGH